MIIKAIPTNIITGFLGVGKTSLIKQLLATKPADEIWAVLVNEFGEVGIDALQGRARPGGAAHIANDSGSGGGEDREGRLWVGHGAGVSWARRALRSNSSTSSASSTWRTR